MGSENSIEKAEDILLYLIFCTCKIYIKFFQIYITVHVILINISCSALLCIKINGVISLPDKTSYGKKLTSSVHA